MIFWTKFAQKRYFWSKTEKKNITITSCIFALVRVPNFTVNKWFWILGANLPKRVFPVKKQKIEHCDSILHIQISLSTKFQLKLTIVIFRTKFAQKGYFQSQTEKMSITIELHINFQLRLTVSIILDQIYPMKVFLVEKGKGEHHHWVMHNRISPGTKFHCKQTNLIFLDLIWPKRVYQI